MRIRKPATELLRLIEKFSSRYEHGDRVWEFYPRLKKRHSWMRVQEVEGTFYFSSDNFKSFSVSSRKASEDEQSDFDLRILTSGLRSIYAAVRRDPLGYHRQLMRTLPPAMRQGVVSRKFVNILIPDYMRFDLELGKRQCSKVIDLLKNHRFTPTPTLTADLYFKYCRLAYLANPKTFRGELDATQSGRELYRSWADGRDGGLLKIAGDSEEAFRKWYESKASLGCHPWEIYRGGNSTHIDLAVAADAAGSGWRVILHAFSSTRMAEACRIALALDEARLPFEIADQESYLRRLLAEDWVGVIPESEPIAYAWQSFPEEFHVADCIHFSWFKPDQGKPLRPLHEVKKLIHWLPIPPLFPKG